jgi:hypothetical protein
MLQEWYDGYYRGGSGCGFEPTISAPKAERIIWGEQSGSPAIDEASPVITQQIQKADNLITLFNKYKKVFVSMILI